MQHDLKIDEPFYQQVVDGNKTFEIRFNDRGYQCGDTVKMEVPYRALPPVYADIGYVTGFQQKDNFVVFSLLNVRRKP